MRCDRSELDLPKEGADLSFAASSLTHAECGEQGAIELLLSERSLLGRCLSCAALEPFGPPNE